MKLLPLLSCLLALATPIHAIETTVLWPGGSTPKPLHGEKAFKFQATAGALVVNFTDGANSDDYIHIDLGKVNLSPYGNGGYLEVEVDVDQPVLRLGAEVTDASNFWEYRQALEGGLNLESGSHTYRFYMDGISAKRLAAGKDNLYLFIQDLGGAARGSAVIKIKKITLVPPSANWQKEKQQIYAAQYHWPKIEKIEPLYYEHLDNIVTWNQIDSTPGARQFSLNGDWKKSYFGEKTWNYAFLADVQPAKPEFDVSSWSSVSVPEPAVAEQKGGYYWYRRTFELPDGFTKGKTYLRFDDLADDGQIYINGTLIGTQTSVSKRLDWVAQNGSRFPFMVNVPIKKAMTWRHFDRCQIPFPFDSASIPDDANRLIMPLYSGEYYWPYAYDITSVLKPGKNTVAVRLYGNPMAGWWIFRHRDDRSARNVFGLLGAVTLQNVANPFIKSFVRRPPADVSEEGLAKHRFECSLQATASQVKEVQFSCGNENQIVPVQAGKETAAEFTLPARFTQYQCVASALGKNGEVLDQQTISFHGVVVSVKKQQLYVNGDPYFVRGVNSSAGVEWDNDRTLSRKEFVRLLRHYQQVGLNTLRIEGLEPWHLEEAFKHGMMIMPVTAAASTDLSMGIFGQLVEPDLRLAWDRQKNLSILLHETPNILMWNGGNEIHHTPGYADREILEKYIEGIQEAFKMYDPYKRPVTFANLDTWAQGWFFFQGQDVIGWNIYNKPEIFAKQLPEVMEAAGGRPIIFTEYGTLKGKPDREGKKIDSWESDMRKNWELILKTPGSVGAFLFAWHGELEDERGCQFIFNLYSPFEITKDEAAITFKNRSEAPMRQVSLLIVRGKEVLRTEYAELIKPGESRTIKLPLKEGGHLEVRYESHRGLAHFYTQNL